jgi:hypothetical protein
MPDSVAVFELAKIDSITFILSDDSTRIPEEGLLAYYPFNGNANDESGNGNHGSVREAVLTTDRFGVSNSAYSFDGVNDYIDIGNNLKRNFPMSISAWIYLNDIDPGSFGQATVFRNDFWDHTSRYYGLLIDNVKGHLVGRIGNGGIAAGGSRFGITTNEVVFSKGDWFHIVVVFISHNTMKLYVNAVEQETGIEQGGTASSMVYSNANGAIGFSRDTGFNGSIDDIRVYDRALSASEIRSLYTEHRFGDSAKL